MSHTLHVTPLRDLVGHDTSTADPDCVCGPEVKPVTQDDGSMGWLLVHHSLDGRERVEGQVLAAYPGRAGGAWEGAGMAAVGAVQVHCPECDVVVPIAMTVKSSTREDDKLIVNVEPDLVDSMAHAWTHGIGEVDL